MKRTTLVSIGSAICAFALVSGAMVGCGDDDDTGGTPTVDGGGGTDSNNTTDTSTNTDSSTGDPKPPTLGAQIDRMGRPAVATALISTFEANDATKGTAKDTYNKDTNAAGWVAAYKAPMSGNLPIYDALDQSCGNQLLAKAGGNNDMIYGTLAGVLADDRLWLNSAGTSAVLYLAVEANAVGVTNTGQGGRTTSMDVIDVTYSAVANGDIIGAPVKDGINADPAKTGLTTFPYLAAP